LDNLMTVGGVSECDAQVPWSSSARGAPIDLVAQAENVPSVHHKTGVPIVIESGNSIVAPQVASLAAILKSLDPGLTPRTLRDEYLKGQAQNGPESQGGYLLNFMYPLGQLLLDRNQGGALCDVLDKGDDQLVDSTGMIVGRICGGLRYQVSNAGTFQYAGDEEIVTGVLQPSQWSLVAPADDAMLFASCEDCEIGLTDFPIDSTAPDPAGIATLDISISPDGADPGNGLAVDGQWTFLECRIAQRSPTNLPFVVVFGGVFEGTLEFAWGTSEGIVYPGFSGSFSAPFTVMGFADMSHPTLEYLESHCEDGSQ
jgi:hypothetical protein